MEEGLIIKAQKGDKDSFSKAVLSLKDEAYRIAYCYLHNKEDSMDAVADAVEKALLNISKLKNDKYFKTWFIRIVINECKIQLRQKQKIISMADDLYKYDDLSKTNREEKIDLERSLTILDPSDRILIYMKYYMGYTLEEVAETMNLPTGTVKTRIYGNLKLLRNKLEVREG
ncbi:sigma-70 family RNA polymerase sigma factor [Alkaliphilus peptidifermentans]|uniref:RNA polymerase, sigma subunit, SigV n=1 Tax=Alkaliphilus peptidifermentans DSM 18978 TaxID=1120976 RepID=A0A1G5KAW5_9FIRM|nr:sigma-70 family RNA polymerase sigma factor [Alkaliphilus peptidifermentans]SCY97170.1 RNA polymerase, sigma subunit, SigV [Alkaliphilus peptidifermentans DSM 18978]